ncbi:MAG: hypothetical protein AAF490_16620 [Chloroflexota bacterium]
MRIRRLLILLGLGLTAVLIFLFFFRRDTNAEFGPAVTLCPGPDLYGYTCESGTGFSYIDAFEDIQLYEDEGVRTLNLPFAFTFYGTPYSEVTVSTNGTLQFGAANPTYFNECMENGSLPAMGDLIAPYWDDLDSRLAGSIDIATVGEAPERIFVVEWDSVPRFGGELDDNLTFQVQLFENNNDILFLYEDVTTSNSPNGRSATIGVQSANQGVALQFSCNQAAVADASRLVIRHPETPNADLGQTIAIASVPKPISLLQKGELETFTAQLNRQGESTLMQWQSRWINEPSPRRGEWAWADLSGNGRSDLILTLSQPQQFSDASALLYFSVDEQGSYQPEIYKLLSTRETAVSAIELLQIVDLTHDGNADALLHSPDTGQYYLLTHHDAQPKVELIPESCTGSWVLRESEENGRLALVREGCETPGRVTMVWKNSQFQRSEP